MNGALNNLLGYPLSTLDRLALETTWGVDLRRVGELLGHPLP